MLLKAFTPVSKKHKDLEQLTWAAVEMLLPVKDFIDSYQEML